MINMVRIQPALKRMGFGRSQGYKRMKQGLLPRGVKIGARAAALSDGEIDAMNRAHLAGASDDELRKLVERLHAARKGVQ